MNNDYQHFTGKDGKLIFYLEWMIPNPKANICIIHGMSDHIARYEHFAKALNEQGYSVYGLDMRGHGMTGLTHNELSHYYGKDGFESIKSDILKLVDLQNAKKSSSKTFIIAHSMGTFVARDLVNSFPERFSGAVFMGTAKYRPILDKKLTDFLAKGVNEDRLAKQLFSVSLKIANMKNEHKTDFDWVSRDDEYIKDFLSDNLVGYAPHFNSVLEVLNELRILHNLEKSNVPIDIPILFISGTNDPVGEYGKGVFSVYKTYKKRNCKDVKIILLKDMRHEIINEINKERVHKTIIDWINSKNI